MKTLSSAFYCGWVRHRRFSPKIHRFRYKVFMVYLDLDELDDVFSISRFWSTKRFALARFDRRDFHGDAKTPLKTALQNTIEQRTGKKHLGPIRVLANLRYFGFNMNPLTTYFCFDPTDTFLEFIVAEVNNTPWGEKHAYVLPCVHEARTQEFHFAKVFHVSPFNPLMMEYRWLSSEPQKKSLIHLENWQGNKKIADATLHLHREAMTATRMNRILLEYPLMTVKVIAAIYWQALRLWLKKVPYFAHPKNTPHHQPIYPKTKGNV
jgi:DUF1365 family protein